VAVIVEREGRKREREKREKGRNTSDAVGV
jgi:hypothetical protein